MLLDGKPGFGAFLRGGEPGTIGQGVIIYPKPRAVPVVSASRSRT